MLSYYKICFTIFLFSVSVRAQTVYIHDVPDYLQPPAQTLPSSTDISNYCAPFAALNILAYWDSTVQHPLANGIMASLPPNQVAEYIGWFMDTNNNGSPNRANVSAQGTYVGDQGPGIFEYFTFDTVNQYGFPLPVPQNKRGYQWNVVSEITPPFPSLMIEIDSNNPVKLDFLHWNIQNTGYTFFDPLISADTIYIYQWDVPVDTSAIQNPENPSEKWNLEQGESNIGHAVTAVGYMPGFTPDPIIPPDDYVIVHDNWRTTPRDIAIPWQNVTALFLIQPPQHPDLTITTVKTSNDTTSGYSDTLKIYSKVSVSTTVRELNGFVIPPFILISEVLDFDGTVINEDTLVYSGAPNKQLQLDSVVVFSDSLFSPDQTGEYTIYSKVFWDHNNDGIINDPPDADTTNDYHTITRFVNYNIIYSQLHLIPDVPDINQPPSVTLPFTLPFNFCAPTAAANILRFWDVVSQHPNAQNVTAGFSGDMVAEYIGWFMDTNDRGDTLAYNGRIFGTASGTYVVDQDSMLRNYVRWDSSHARPLEPSLPASKTGYDWIYQTDFSVGFPFYEAEILAARPVKVDFLHWNISFTDTIFVDTLKLDTVYLYSLGTYVMNSTEVDPEAPDEEWNNQEGLQNIGHAVTGVGYIIYGPQNQRYAIVHDNWHTTPQHVAVRWKDWVVSMAMYPRPTSTIPVEGFSPLPSFYLAQNFPNPFNARTVITYSLPKKSDVSLIIFNNLGQKVAILYTGQREAGLHKIVWDASGLSSGIYFFCIRAGQYSQIRKGLLLR